MLFSIIIPTYNRGHLIEKAIHSVQSQDYAKFEIIIVDDGSTDGTGEIVSKISDTRIRYFYKANEERGAARNFGVRRALGDYITFLDSDDLVYPNHLSEAIQIIHDHNWPVIFHLAYEVKDASGTVLRQENKRQGMVLNNYLLNGNHLSCIGVFIRREEAILNPFQQERMFMGTEDWELWLRLAARYDIFYSNTITGCMIEHETRSVNQFSLGKFMYATELLLLYLRQDDGFMEKFGKKLNYIESEMVSLMALNLAVTKQNYLSISFLIEAISINYRELLKRRFLAIIKIIGKNIFKSIF